MQNYRITKYEEAVQVIQELGILPLSDLIPGYLSLVSITPKENWHTGSELDPWQWRTKFAAEGHAAYGKFLKKKAVLISRELFPYVQAVLGSSESMEERYESGIVSSAAYQLFQLISADEGIETRALRATAKMKDKEQKKTYDRGIQELQSSLDIVIAGVKERRNALGEVNGWKSTSFQTAEYWMRETGIEKISLNDEEARGKLLTHLEARSNAHLVNYLRKIV